jgi:histidine ammonia-lyase
MQVQLNDVARVVLFREDFTLDKAVADRIDESAALFSKSPISEPMPPLFHEDKEETPYLPLEFSRAALYGCVISICQGRSGVRSDVVRALLKALEYEVIPCFSSLDNIPVELALFLSGKDVDCFYYENVYGTEAAFLSSGVSPCPLTEHELQIMSRSHFFFCGIAALLANSTGCVFQMLDVVAAVSCDAAGASPEPFEANNYELYLPHRGMISSAANLRQMLEGSKRSTAGAPTVAPCFVSIPNYHGPAQELVAGAMK